MKRTLLRRTPLALLAVALLLAVFGTWLFAQGEGTTSTADVDTPNGFTVRKVDGVYVTVYTKATVTQGDGKFTADTIEQRTQNKNVHTFTCTGNPVYTSPESTVSADKLVANSSPRNADFTGNVKAVRSTKKQDQGGKLLGNATTVVTSQRLTYDYGKKWAEFTGGTVTMVNTPAEGATAKGDVNSEISKEPSTMTCTKLSYDYAGKKAFATGSPGNQVHIVQKDRDIWADQGTFDEGTSLVVLKGNVIMKNAGSEELKSIENVDTATISLDNDWMDLQPLPGKHIKMHFLVKEDQGDKK